MEEVFGMSNGVTLKLHDLSGKVSFTIFPMDDFEVVLGKEFMRKVKETPMPHLNNFFISLG
jgi:hypothetical protein